MVWKTLDEFEPNSTKIVWVWNRVIVQLAIGFHAWKEDTLGFYLVDVMGTMRVEVHGVIMWTDFVAPDPPG